MRRRLLVGGLAAGLGVLALAAALVRGPGPEAAGAASHREAPLISMDPTADITDFFMFRSYEPGQDDKVVLIMDVIPGEEPSSGPNYWNFDPNVQYSFHIDNNKDGEDDITFNFRFQTEPIRGTVDALDLPLSFVAVPPITSLDGPGSAGIGLRQRYSVEMLTGRGRAKRDVLTTNRIVVPSNVGPRTTPNYPALAAQGIYDVGGGAKVFAGQRDDPFYIDLGGVFDTLNLRRPLPIESDAEDASDTTNPFGVDMLGGFNVHEIALQVPASWLTMDHKSIAGTSQPVLGGYASTSRPKVTVQGRDDLDSLVLDADGSSRGGLGHKFVQIQRLANPLINEVIIGTEDKDLWNRTEPEDESQFLDYYLNPRLAVALQLVTGVPAATMGRTDLVNALLHYTPGDRASELLRLDLSVAPRPFASQKRLTVLAGDNAGWPNGRRPKDDVTDIAVRLVGGGNYIAAHAADGVNTNDKTLSAQFPFLATPWDGRSSNHPHA
jgi:hypothetical protein